MQNLLLLLAKFGNHILFVLLQIICFVLIVNYNKDQKSIYLNSSNLLSGSINAKFDEFADYLLLEKINDSLLYENALLIEQIIDSNVPIITDSTRHERISQFNLIPSNICNNTHALRNNFLTLCRGEKSGIRSGMGVIDEKGIVGIVKNISDNYAQVISMLNSQTRISVTLKTQPFYGNLIWKNMNPSKMTVEAIPKHAEIAVGDTLITSGYSSIFPRGLDVGVVENFSVKKGSSNYEIRIKLFNDLTSVHYVYVIENYKMQEQITLESENE